MARRYRKVEGPHGQHGGAWKVAYADFVTAMMALFMVMWLLASTDLQARQEISQYFRTGVMPEGHLSVNRASQLAPPLFEASAVPRPSADPADERRAEAARQVSEQLRALGAMDPELARVAHDASVTVTRDGVVIETADEGNGLLFDRSSARLDEPLQRFLRALGPVLARMDSPIEINGHTDALPFREGSRESNWELSYRRAAAAREILEASGLRSDRIVGVIARGASQLYVPDQPLAARNRRLSILVKIAKADAGPAPAPAPTAPNRP